MGADALLVGSPRAGGEPTAFNRAATAFADEAAAEYGLPDEAFARSGKGNGAAAPRGLEANAACSRHQTALGEAHEMPGAQAMRALTGSDHCLGGLCTPGAALIQPAMFVRGVAQGLAPRVAIFEDTPVTARRARRHGLARGDAQGLRARAGSSSRSTAMPRALAISGGAWCTSISMPRCPGC